MQKKSFQPNNEFSSQTILHHNSTQHGNIVHNRKKITNNH